MEEAKTDEELLAEALEEERLRNFNKYIDADSWNSPLAKKYIAFALFNGQFVRPDGKYEPQFSGFIIFCIMIAGVLVGMQVRVCVYCFVLALCLHDLHVHVIAVYIFEASEWCTLRR